MGPPADGGRPDAVGQQRGVAPDDRALAAFINQVRSISDEELNALAREFLAEDSAAHAELYKPPRDAIAAPRDSG